MAQSGRPLSVLTGFRVVCRHVIRIDREPLPCGRPLSVLTEQGRVKKNDRAAATRRFTGTKVQILTERRTSRYFFCNSFQRSAVMSYVLTEKRLEAAALSIRLTYDADI